MSLGFQRTEFTARPTRFMGSLHDFRITHRDHEPATDRSADSLVRECLGLDSCGHGCPHSDSGFMESPLSLFRMHCDHEPPLTRPSGTLSPSEGERDGVRGRFLGRGHLQNSDVNRGHESDWHPSPCPLPARWGEGGRRPGEGAVHGQGTPPKNGGASLRQA